MALSLTLYSPTYSDASGSNDAYGPKLPTILISFLGSDSKIASFTNLLIFEKFLLFHQVDIPFLLVY